VGRAASSSLAPIPGRGRGLCRYRLLTREVRTWLAAMFGSDSAKPGSVPSGRQETGWNHCTLVVV
jgi:hypothetical protein